MEEIPEDILTVAKSLMWPIADEYETSNQRGAAFWSGEVAPRIIAKAIFGERQRCADMVRGWGLTNGAEAILSSSTRGE